MPPFQPVSGLVQGSGQSFARTVFSASAQPPGDAHPPLLTGHAGAEVDLATGVLRAQALTTCTAVQPGLQGRPVDAFSVAHASAELSEGFEVWVAGSQVGPVQVRLDLVLDGGITHAGHDTLAGLRGYLELRHVDSKTSGGMLRTVQSFETSLVGQRLSRGLNRGCRASTRQPRAVHHRVDQPAGASGVGPLAQLGPGKHTGCPGWQLRACQARQHPARHGHAGQGLTKRAGPGLQQIDVDALLPQAGAHLVTQVGLMGIAPVV